MARQAKQKSWWLQNVGTKSGPACPLCKKHAGCKCKHTEKVTPLTVCCGKPAKKCKCSKKPTKPVHMPAEEYNAKKTNNGPGVCGCGAYLFPNGKCRDFTCKL